MLFLNTNLLEFLSIKIIFRNISNLIIKNFVIPVLINIFLNILTTLNVTLKKCFVLNKL